MDHHHNVRAIAQRAIEWIEAGVAELFALADLMAATVSSKDSRVRLDSRSRKPACLYRGSYGLKPLTGHWPGGRHEDGKAI